jgi:hypothetical protein
MRIVLFFLVLSIVAFTPKNQGDDYACKVAKKSLEGEYIGDCKKGLAHGEGWSKGTDTYKGHWKKGFPDGKGEYTWANGESYNGSFKMGKRHGQGTMTEFTNDLLMEGKLSVWKNDEFVEVVMEKKYKVFQKLNVQSVTFKKESEDIDRVEIYLKNVNSLEDLDVVVDSGQESQTGKYIYIDYVTFPLTVNMTYTTLSKLGNTYNVTVKFEIESKGDWRIEVSNIN